MKKNIKRFTILISAMFVLQCSNVFSATNPIVNIKANGLLSPITINQSSALSVNVDIDPGNLLGSNADWWVVAKTPSGDWYSWVYPTGWIQSGSDLNRISVAYQGSLFALPPYEVLNVSNLPLGNYSVYFGVDTNMNGTLDLSALYYTTTSITVSLNGPIPFSTIGYVRPTGDVASAEVGKGYNQKIYVGSDPSETYNINLAPGWSLPPGLQLQYINGTPASNGIQNASSFLVASVNGSTPIAPGQYNVAFLATDTTNPTRSDTVVYHFLVKPSVSAFQGTVSSKSRLGQFRDGSALASNPLVLPPGILNQPYRAKIALSNGTVSSVALVTQLFNGGTLASAINTQIPVPGLISGEGGNVNGIDLNTGNLTPDNTANVAGLSIKWSTKSNSVTISGKPTVSFGGLNDPLILQISGPNNQKLYYNFAMTYSPKQIAQAYGFDKVMFNGGIQGNGAGQTVAILAIGDNSAFVSSSDPNFGNSDLAQFDRAFGINNFDKPGGPVFLKLDENGGTNYPSQSTGYEDPTEVPQDIEWVHALAPMANIVVIELADTNQNANAALNLIANWNLPGVKAPSVVTSSFGATSLNGTPYAPNVTYLASSGDFGNSGENGLFANPQVIEVGYSQLKIGNGGHYMSEQGVNGGVMQTTDHFFMSGGGFDATQSQPSYQQYVPNTSILVNPVSTVGRTAPDIGFNGAETSGVAVYDSYINTTTTNFKSGGTNYSFGGSPWGNAWGTSISTPSCAALMSITNQGLALSGKKSLDGFSQTLPKLYSLAGTEAFNLIGSTINQSTQQITDVPSAKGTSYYNSFTGLGSPVANLLISKLVSLSP